MLTEYAKIGGKLLVDLRTTGLGISMSGEGGRGENRCEVLPGFFGCFEIDTDRIFL